jgi:DNA adenine methylase
LTATLPPAIKWSGSKRLQAARIIQLFPRFNTYYEPFLGGGSLVGQLAPPSSVCGDICAPLIQFWNVLQRSPHEIVERYTDDWNRLQKDGWTVFYEIRKRFNRNPNPFDLLFLSRTCVNGLIRFNREGKFNNSLHYTRKGIEPSKLQEIISLWSDRLKHTNFRLGDYREVTADAASDDFVYLDPPYFNTRGRFYGRIDFDEFLDFLSNLKKRQVRFALSFDGSVGNTSYVVQIPKDLYSRHVFLKAGSSTFPKVMNQRVTPVKESLYLSWPEQPSNPENLLSFRGLEQIVQSS